MTREEAEGQARELGHEVTSFYPLGGAYRGASCIHDRCMAMLLLSPGNDYDGLVVRVRCPDIPGVSTEFVPYPEEGQRHDTR